MVSGFAQEAANSKIQAGLTLSSGLNFISPNTKVIESNGIGSNLGVGMALQYSFTTSIGFSTGLIFDFETLKYKSSASDSLFYLYNDAKISANKDYMSESGTLNATDNILYRVNSRTQKPLYLTIPTMLLFRTKFI